MIARLFAILIALLPTAAVADIVGNPPVKGGDFATIDQKWLNGLAGG
jgi:hypothetical protein